MFIGILIKFSACFWLSKKQIIISTIAKDCSALQHEIISPSPTGRDRRKSEKHCICGRHLYLSHRTVIFKALCEKRLSEKISSYLEDLFSLE